MLIKNPIALIGMCAGAIAVHAYAADGEVEEVVVTATKTEKLLQEVPFSVNVKSGQDIQDSGIVSFEELSRTIAGLSVQNLGPGQSQVAIRGVSAGQIVRDQPGVKEQVGVYLDESVVSMSLFTPDFDLYDLNRVETLRGPQGTLFGAGSIGGTVRYITNKPRLGENEKSFEIDFNTLADGGMGGHVKGMTNLALSNNTAVRFVGFSTQFAGFIDALFETGGTKKDVNSGHRSGFRAAVYHEPNDRFALSPRIVHQAVSVKGFNRTEVFNLYGNPYTTTRPAVEFKPRQQYLLRDELMEDDTTLVDMTATWDMEAIQFTSITSVMNRDLLVSRDSSALTGSVTIDLDYPEAAVLIPSNLRDKTNFEQLTQELRIQGAIEAQSEWVAGFFYSDTRREYGQSLPTPGYDGYTDLTLGPGTVAATKNGFPLPDSPFNSTLPYDIEHMALFMEYTHHVTERFRLTVGGRYYDVNEQRTITTGGLFANGDTGVVDRTASDGFNPRILTSFSLTESLNWNVQVARGFRLGGVNDPLNTPACTPGDLNIFGSFQSYRDEYLWNYETGIVGSWRRTTFSAAAFHASIENLQVTLDAGSCSSRISFNVPEARARGLEFELNTLLSEAFELSVAMSKVNSVFEETVFAESGDILGGVEEGNRLASVPRTQFASTAKYTIPREVFGSARLYISFSMQYVSDRITQPSDQVPGAGNFSSGLPYGGATGSEVTSVDLNLDSYTIMGFRLGVVQQRWETVFYVQNATDEFAHLSFDRERGGRARLGFRTNEPRKLGVVFRRNF